MRVLYHTAVASSTQQKMAADKNEHQNADNMATNAEELNLSSDESLSAASLEEEGAGCNEELFEQ